MPRSPRTSLERGIYQDAAGYEVAVMVAGQRRSQRWPPGTSRQQLRAALAALTTGLQRRERSRATGTLAGDAPRYLAAVRAMPSYPDRARQIAQWVAVLGDRRRDSLTSADVAAQLHRWRSQYAAQTCNLLRTALSQLYTVLDGKDAPNPARAVPKFPVDPPLARAIPMAAVTAILRRLRKDGATRARLAVIAYTGMGHAELRRLQPEDVRLEAGVVVARARRKGKGAAPRVIPLTRRAAAALRLFVRLQAWGAFSRSSMHSAFRRACVNAGYADMDWRPYDLRHTFGTEVVLASGDQKAAQVLLGHASPVTTDRYTLGAAQARAAAAVAAMDRRR